MPTPSRFDPILSAVLWRALVVAGGALAAHYALEGSAGWAYVGGVAAIVLVLAGWAAWSFGREIAPLQHRVASLASDSGHDAHGAGSASLHAMAESVGRAQSFLDEARLRAERERDDVRGILEAATDGIVVLGPGAKVDVINESARRLLAPRTDPLGRPLAALVRHPEILAFAERLQSGEEPAPIRVELPGFGEPRWVSVSGATVRGETQHGRAVLILHDMTDLRLLERVRTDFVANVTHEMRSPLASILGYAETLADGQELEPADQQSALERIQRNARRLDDIIRDLIELSRLEHATAAETAPTDVAELVKACTTAVRDAAMGKGIKLEEDVSGLNGLYDIDAGLVHQALSNLVDNAVKYTPQRGSVRVVARVVPGTLKGTGDGRTLEIAVTDTGAGIAPEHHGRVFERFYRVDTARSRALGGTGLGLAIVKHAAALHGGNVHLTSTPGRGSTFRLTLPLPATRPR